MSDEQTAAAPPAAPQPAYASIVIDGRTIPLAKFGPAEWAEFIAWAQDQYAEPLLRNLRKLPAEIAGIAAGAVLGRAALFHRLSPEVAELMVTPAGMARFHWIAARKAAPDLTIEQVEAYFRE